MSIRINYGYETVTLPAAAMSVLERAQAADIRLLMALCTDKQLRGRPENDYAVFAQAAGITEAQTVASLAFWRGAGILVTDRETAAPASAEAPAEKPAAASEVPAGQPAAAPAAAPSAAPAAAPEEPPKAAKPGRHDQLPNYTTDQISEMLEQNPDTAAYLDEAVGVWGKMFNTHDYNIILGLVDYLGLEWEYVLILLAYCRSYMEKRGYTKSLHFVETTAFSFYDEGVTDSAALTERIKRMEKLTDTEGQLRTLFGMGTRSLTASEKRTFSAWLYDFGYDIEIIRRAYDITVDTIGEPKLRYINTILNSWHGAGCKTPAEIDKFEQEKPRPKGKTKPDTARKMASSFETEDFFEAAVRRNFDPETDPDNKS